MRILLKLMLALGFVVFMAGSTLAADCVEIDIEAPGQVYLGQQATFSAELTNCGDEAATIFLSFEIIISGEPVPLPPVQVPVHLAAGETYSKTMTVMIPPNIPTGTYEVCIMAESGDASDSDCAVIEVIAPDKGRYKDDNIYKPTKPHIKLDK